MVGYCRGTRVIEMASVSVMATPAINQKFQTAIVPAAGLGTRFLPATKTVPKELFPVVDTPGIELVAEEAAEAGAERLIIVTSPAKESIADYFRRAPELEASLARKGKMALLDKVRRAPRLLDIDVAIQEEALGLGHAVACAEAKLTDADDAVAVLLPDDLLFPAGALRRMANIRAEYGGSVLVALEVPPDEVSAYGVFDVTPTDDADIRRVRGMVEKPAAEEAPSNLIAPGRYLLDRAIFDAIRRTPPGAGGEIQLTDAIGLLIAEGHPVRAVVHRGNRHDLGNPSGFLRAAIDRALDHPDYGPQLTDWLAGRLAGSRGEGPKGS